VLMLEPLLVALLAAMRAHRLLHTPRERLRPLAPRLPRLLLMLLLPTRPLDQDQLILALPLRAVA
jgi:hypothetical protein